MEYSILYNIQVSVTRAIKKVERVLCVTVNVGQHPPAAVHQHPGGARVVGALVTPRCVLIQGGLQFGHQ